jgi:hypothetical protein
MQQHFGSEELVTAPPRYDPRFAEFRAFNAAPPRSAAPAHRCVSGTRRHPPRSCARRKTANVLNIQPVLPFTAGDWNIISRTIAPLISFPSITAGLEDVAAATPSSSDPFGLDENRPPPASGLSVTERAPAASALIRINAGLIRLSYSVPDEKWETAHGAIAKVQPTKRGNAK